MVFPIESQIQSGAEFVFHPNAEGDVGRKGFPNLTIGESEAQLEEGNEAAITQVGTMIAVGQEVEFVERREVVHRPRELVVQTIRAGLVEMLGVEILNARYVSRNLVVREHRFDRHTRIEYEAQNGTCPHVGRSEGRRVGIAHQTGQSERASKLFGVILFILRSHG